MATVRRDVFRSIGGCALGAFDALNQTALAAPTTTTTGGTAYACSYHWDGAAYTSRTYVWIHLTSPITSAEAVVLDGDAAGNSFLTNFISAGGGDNFNILATAYSITTDWTPADLTWNNQPALGASFGELSVNIQTDAAGGSFVTIDPLAKTRMSFMRRDFVGAGTVYGFVLVPSVSGTTVAHDAAPGHLNLTDSFVLA